MADWNQIQGNWQQYRTTVLQQWEKLGEDEFNSIGGKRELLTSKLREVYNLTDEEAERQVSEWETDYWTGA